MSIIDIITYDVILAIAASARLSATVKTVYNHAFLLFYFLLWRVARYEYLQGDNPERILLATKGSR